MRKEFTLPVKLISVNSTYYANKLHGMRPEAKEFQYKCFHALSMPEAAADLAALREAFDPKLHGYSVTITSLIPETSFYNKQKQLSSKMCDLSNVEKGIIDVLFLPKYYGPNVPYQCLNLNVDDKYLVDLRSSKRPSSGDYAVCISIELVELASFSITEEHP